MALIHHIVAGHGRLPIVFVHGFACAHRDWDAQVARFSSRHRTVAVDLRGHGASPGAPDECSIERYGADVAEVMRALALPPAVIVGHSMGCRVAVEAGLQAPGQTAGVVLVDGSQFAPEMQATLEATFFSSDGYASLIRRWFQDMFTARSDPDVAASVLERARNLPQAIGQKLLLDMVRYDVGRLATSLSALRVPVMALQTTYSNERRERRSMGPGQATPYLDMLRTCIHAVRIEVIADTGHFPQIDTPDRTNLLLEDFLGQLSAG
jgi:pimeloyl-ACP methyl ester carboxylesterase